MQVFYNTRLGLSYKNSETVTTAKQLRDRAEKYPLRVLPDAALVAILTADTQPNRLEVQIEAWGPGLEHWVIDYIVLNGAPTDPPDTPGSVWQRLDEIRRTPLLHASGRPIMISAYGIDAGGANTQDVYNYGSARRTLNCTVLHGSSRPNKPIMGSAPSRVDIDWGGTKTPGGVELWTVGTDVAKDWLSNRMQLAEGPGAMHFNDALPPEWFDQMVVEQARTRWQKGRAIREWVKPNGARNEAWDVSVYNLAIAHQLGLHKWTPLDWQRLRDKLIPPIGDLFAPVPAPVPAPVLAAAPVPEPVAPVAPVPQPAPVPVQTSVHAEAPSPASVVLPPPAMPPPAPVPPPPPVAARSPLPHVARPAPVGRRIYSRGIQ